MILTRRILVLLLFAWAPLPLGGCAINPETGEWYFVLVAPEEEEAIGAETHQQILTEFGGVYYDPALAAFVERVGRALAEQTLVQDFDYRFTILDSPDINAFALPGGYIYVTRGLLALASSEAELAGVLAHELAHVTARHGAQRLSRMKAKEKFCATFVCDFEVPVLGDMAAIGLELAFAGFTQSQELEADEIGLRYLARAGYDRQGMVRFLTKLKAQTELETAIAGLSVEQRKARGYSSTHPLTQDRIELASELAARDGGGEHVGEREYLAVIDGMLYGNRREYGFVRSGRYVHPIRRVAFDVPPGYTLYPDSRRVTAIGADGGIILFEPSRMLFSGSVQDYLRNLWAKGLDLNDPREIDVNGMEGATAWLRRSSEYGVTDYRLVAIREPSGVIYRFLFISPAARSLRLSEGMRRVTYSFRSLSEEEAAQQRPLRLRIVTTGTGSSMADLARQSDFSDNARARLAVMNGLDVDTPVEPGRIVKLVRNESLGLPSSR